jgi:Protein of unknown function (DUF2786)
MRDYATLVGHLLAKAESAEQLGQDKEAAAYQAKAEKLMREYRISEEEAIATDFSHSILPQRFEVTILEGDGYASDFRYEYVAIWEEIARHAGLRSHCQYVYDEQDRQRKIVAVGYGYEGDIRLAKFLWTSAHLVFITRIDASVNPKLSDQENCYYLRNSGMQRNAVAYALWGSDFKDGVAHGKVQKLYLAECAKRGESPRVSGRGIQVGIYRQAYADAFVDQFGWKLRQARDAADSVAGALDLPGRLARISEAYYAEWPDRRPETAEERAARRAEEAMMPPPPPCAACAKTKSPTGQCRNCRPRYATAGDRARWERRTNGPEARAGRRAGAAAADGVNVARTAPERHQSTDAAPERTAIG